MHLYTHREDKVAPDRPQGVNPPSGKRNVLLMYSGDTVKFSTRLFLPGTSTPLSSEACSSGTKITVTLSENRFSPAIWAYDTDAQETGILTFSEDTAGLVSVVFPKEITDRLRRGSYMFSIAVSTQDSRETQVTGHIQVEYHPSGSVNNIPYRSYRASDPETGPAEQGQQCQVE